jgi:neutral ceramidase
MNKLVNHSMNISRRNFIKASASMSLATVANIPDIYLSRIKILKAGAAAVDITPGMDVTLKGPIAGAITPKGILDRLNARAIILDDGITQIGIIVCDVCIISQEICDKAKELIQQRTGIPTNRILISATHSHSVVRAIELGNGEAHEKYMDSLSVWIANAAEKAFNNIAPAKIGWAVINKPEHCTNRLWFMKPGTIRPNPFGENTDQLLMGGFRDKDNAVRSSGPVDPALSVLSLQFSDGRPMALIANYSIHYGTSGDMVSADYFGHYARGIENLLGIKDSRPPMIGMMCNGTSGDISNGGEPVKLAQSLIEATMNIYKEIKHTNRVPLSMEESELEIGIRLPSEERVKWAKQVLSEEWEKPADAHPWTEIFARNTLKLANWQPSCSFKFQALRIGQLGIAAVPTETYAKTGLAIKKESPLNPTFIISLANGYGGYLPAPEDFDLGGYSTWTTTSSFMEKQAEPKIRNEAIRLLTNISR